LARSAGRGRRYLNNLNLECSGVERPKEVLSKAKHDVPGAKAGGASFKAV